MFIFTNVNSGSDPNGSQDDTERNTGSFEKGNTFGSNFFLFGVNIARDKGTDTTPRSLSICTWVRGTEEELKNSVNFVYRQYLYLRSVQPVSISS